MKPYERTQLLDRIDREGATVGASIPEEVALTATGDGEELFPLREFVFEVKRHESVPPDRVEEVEDVKKRLRRERLARRQRLEEADISYEEGEELVEEIIGIERALDGLESLGATDVEAEATAKKRADEQRWLNFLDRALGRENRSGGRP